MFHLSRALWSEVEKADPQGFWDGLKYLEELEARSLFVYAEYDQSVGLFVGLEFLWFGSIENRGKHVHINVTLNRQVVPMTS